jgi:hypothetical protein
MVCLKTWEVKSKSDFNNYQEWCDFVNKNYRYAKNTSKTFDWVGNCIPTNLISAHPYWEYLIKKDLTKKIERHKNNLIEIKKDRNKLKILYNLWTKFEDVEKDIKRLEEKVEKINKRIRL